MVDERAYVQALRAEHGVERSFRIDAKRMSDRTLLQIARSRKSRLSEIAALEHRRRHEVERVLRDKNHPQRPLKSSRLARFYAAAARDPAKVVDPSLFCDAGSLGRLAGASRRWTSAHASAHRDALRSALAASPAACAELVRRAARRAPCLLGPKYGTYRDMLLLGMRALGGNSARSQALEDRVREDVMTVLDKNADTERLLLSSPDAVERATMLLNAADLLSEIVREDGKSWDLLRRRVFLAIGDFCDAILSNGMMAYDDGAEHQAVVMRAAAELGPLLSELASRHESVRCVVVAVACFMAATVRSAWGELSTHGAYAHRAVRVFQTFPGLPSAVAEVIVPRAGQYESKEQVYGAWIKLLDTSIKNIKMWYEYSRRRLLTTEAPTDTRDSNPPNPRMNR